MSRTLQAASLALLLAATPLASAQHSASLNDPREARALLAKVADSLGGQAAFQKVNGIRYRWVASIEGLSEPGEINGDTLTLFPDRTHTYVRKGSLETVFVYTPTGSFMVRGGQIQDSANPEVAKFVRFRRRNLVYLLHRATDPDFSSAVSGSTRIGDFDARILELTVGNDKVQLFVEPESGRALGESFVEQDEGGPVEYSVTWSDWRRVGGLALPYRSHYSAGGQGLFDVQIVGIQMNPTEDPTLFRKPPANLQDVPFTPAAAAPFMPLASTMPSAATLAITTKPGGAEVYLDDEPKGSSSADQGHIVLRDLTPGAHSLRVSLEGHREWAKGISLTAGETANVDAELVARADAPFTLDEVVEMLRGSVSNARVSALVRKQGVDFQLGDTEEKRIREAGGDAELLVVIAKGKK